MPATERLPRTLGPYRLQDRLGEGGMGVVHLAQAPDGSLVAIKVLNSRSEDTNARRRLAREVETMRRVHNTYVAEVLDADVTGEFPYIVTRFVNGPTLEQLVRARGPMSASGLRRLACGTAEALAAIHAAGVVHRDLKPSNVMLTDDRPVVIDFGIAQVGDSTKLTLTGLVMGTPGYLAPEVIEGQPSSPASDVHSWGATMAYAATGRAPFGSGTYETIFYRIVSGRPDLDGIPAPLVPLFAAALARDPARRPTAAALSAQANAVDLSAPAPAPAHSPPAPISASVPVSAPAAYSPAPAPGSAPAPASWAAGAPVPGSVWWAAGAPVPGPVSWAAGAPAPGQAPASWSAPVPAPARDPRPSRGKPRLPSRRRETSPTCCRPLTTAEAAAPPAREDPRKHPRRPKAPGRPPGPRGRRDPRRPPGPRGRRDRRRDRGRRIGPGLRGRPVPDPLLRTPRAAPAPRAGTGSSVLPS